MATQTRLPEPTPIAPAPVPFIRQLFQAAAEAIVLMDERGEIFLTNPSCEKMFGYSEEELIGRTIEILIPDLFKDQQKKFREQYLHDLQTRLMGTGRDLVGLKKDGSEFPIEVRLSHYKHEGALYLVTYISDISIRKEAEQERLILEERFNKSFDGAPLAASITHLKSGQFVAVNRNFQILTGFSREEVIGKTPIDLKIQPNWEVRNRIVHRVKQDGSGEFELHFRDKYGCSKIVLAAMAILEMHEDPHVLTFFNDITHSYEAESALMQSEARYRALFGSMEDALFVVDYESGRLVDCNKEACNRMGLDKKDLLALDIESIIPTAFRAHHPIIQRKLEPYQPFRFQTIHVCKNSMEMPVEVSALLVRIDGQKLVFSMARDIRERLEASQALQREKDLLQTYMDISKVIFVIIGSDKRVRMINRYGLEVMGYEENEVVGKNWFTHFIPTRQRKQVRTIQREILTNGTGRYQPVENTIRTKSGEERIISWQNILLTDDEGNPEATLSSGIDITEKKQHDANLTEAIVAGQEKERKRLAEDLHDGLGPLLSTVKNNLEAIEPLLNSNQSTRIKYYENSKWLLEKAIQEVREMSHNLMPKTLSEFGLASALKGLAELMNGTQGIQIRFYSDFDERLAMEHLEITLYRIAQEVLNNAIRHSHASSITIQLIKHTDTVMMAVEDNGRGFDPDRLEPGNPGIGLRSIKSRANSVNGHVLIESSPGHGTLVITEVPVSREHKHSKKD